MQITDIRRHNLTEWFSDRPIPEKEKSYISQLKNGRGSFGEKAARRLEQTYSMPTFYLDQPIPNSSVMISNTNSLTTTEPEYANLVSPEEDDEHHHRLDWLDVRAAAGLVEYSNADCPEIIQSIWLSDDGMLELVGKRSANGLRIINVPTDSMEPTIPKGAMVVLDTKTAHYTGDGIYAFSIDGNLFIKRLQRKIKGGYLVISDNKPKYRDEEMESEFIDNAVFVGKFVRVWEIKATEL